MRFNETRVLTNEELTCLYILSKISYDYKFNDKFVFGKSEVLNEVNIFKYSRDKSWIIWKNIGTVIISF